MAEIFVRGASGLNTNSGADWLNAKKSIAGALAIAVSNDVILADNTEMFTGITVAEVTWTPPAGGNVSIISALKLDDDVLWEKSWGASETLTTINGPITVAGTNGSSMYVYGMELVGNSASNGLNGVSLLQTLAVSSTLFMENCDFRLTSINTVNLACGVPAASSMRGTNITLKDCTIRVTGSRLGEAVRVGKCFLEMISCEFIFSGANKPATIFAPISVNDYNWVTVRDCDFQVTVSAAMLLLTNMASSTFLFKNCKLRQTFTGGWAPGVASVTFRNCLANGGVDTIFFEYHNYYGSLITTTVAYMTDGVVFDGVPVSWLISSGARNEYNPFVCPIIEVWNDTTGTRTATIEITSDVAVTDREIWVEATYDYFTTTLISNRNADPFIGTPVAHPSSSAVWVSGQTSKQKLEFSFTTTRVGLLQARIYIASSAATYINPMITLS